MREFRSLIVVAIAALTACGGDAGAGGGGTSTRAPSGTVSVCLPAEPAMLDPFLSSDQAAGDLMPVLFTPLVHYGPTGAVEPYLATDWSWSEDRRNLEFRLRDDVRWHDGEPVTAADVAWTITAAADTAFAYWNGSDLASLDSVAAGDGTVDLWFATPNVWGVEMFAVLPILPRHLLTEYAAPEFPRAEYHRSPVGSGPYRVSGRAGDNSLVLERVNGFPAELGAGGPARIVLRFIAEAPTQLVELQTGGIDACVMGSSSADEVADIESLDALAIGPAGVAIIPLSVDQPPLDDARVRRALSAALDRREIAAVMSPVASPAGTFMPENNPYLDADLRQPDADPELAAALLDSAGWRRPAEGAIRVNAAGEPLRFEVVGPQQAQTFLTIAQEQLRRSGVDMRLRLLEGGTFVETLQNPDTRPAATALVFTPDRVAAFDPYSELHSDGYANYSSYANASVDSLLERLQTPVPDEERSEIFRALQRVVSEDVPSLYTVYLPRLLAVGPRLQGVEVTAAAGPFANVTEWSVR